MMHRMDSDLDRMLSDGIFKYFATPPSLALSTQCGRNFLILYQRNGRVTEKDEETLLER